MGEQLTQVHIEAALEQVWAAAKRPPPAELVVDTRTYDAMEFITEEEVRRRQITSPLGLRRMFPGLPART